MPWRQMGTSLQAELERIRLLPLGDLLQLLVVYRDDDYLTALTKTLRRRVERLTIERFNGDDER